MSANLFRQALGDGRWQRWRRRNRGPSSKSPTTITGCCCFEHLLLFDRQAPISSTAFDLCLSTMDVSMATGAAAAAGTAADPPPPAASNAGIPPSSPPEDPLAVKQRLWLAEKEAFDSWREPVVRQIAAKSNLERKARSRVAEYRRTIAIAQAEAREWQKKLEEAELDKKEAEETLQSKHALVKQKELQYQITKAERDRRIAAKVQKDQERAELQAKLAQLDAECEERNRAVEDHKRPRDGHGEDTRPAHVAQRRRISGISQDSQSEIAASLADLAAGGAGTAPVGGARGETASDEEAKAAIRDWYGQRFPGATMTFEGSLENLDQGEESDTGSIDAGAQLSFKYSSSTDGILYLVNGLSLFVDENGDWKVDSEAFARLLRTRNRSEGFWGPQDWFDSNGDPPYNPDE